MISRIAAGLRSALPLSHLQLRLDEVGSLLDQTFRLYRGALGVATAASAATIGLQALCSALMAATLSTSIMIDALSLHALAGNLFLPAVSILVALIGANTIWVRLLENPAGLFAGLSAFVEWLAPFAALMLVGAVLGLAAVIVEGSLTHYYYHHSLGRPVRWTASLRAGLARWRPLWISSAARFLPGVVAEGAFLFGLLLIASAILDAVIYRYMIWASVQFGLTAILIGAGAGWVFALMMASPPAIMLEGLGGWRSLRRSVQLSRRLAGLTLARLLSFWLMRMLLIAVPVMLLLRAPDEMVGSSLLSPAGALAWVLWIGLTAASSVIAFPLASAFMAASYLDLRLRCEHLDFEQKVARLVEAASANPSAVDASVSP